MPVANAEVAAVFTDIADLLELENANPFRVRAYRTAAHTLGELSYALHGLVDQPEKLDALPGIGPDLAGKIVEVLQTGSCGLLQQLQKELPAGMTALLKVPGLGPSRVRLLHRALGVATVEQLRQAAQSQRIQTLRGFGARSEQRILEAVNSLLLQPTRQLRTPMEEQAQTLLAGLAALAGVHQSLAAGSLRRGSETVGDLDLLVTCDKPRAVMAHFSSQGDVQRVLQQGMTRCSVLLKSGVQVDLRAVAPVSFGAAALYFTGSKLHNIALRQRALERGCKLNEYGLYRGRQRLAGDTEEAVYAALGLPWITPELRENRGEIAAAERGQLPRLLELADLQGDLHAHSLEGDGQHTLLAMVEAARAQGLHYLGIADCAQSPARPGGLDGAALARQGEQIDAVNAQLQAQGSAFVLLKGVEVEILEDGSLALPEAELRHLDLVVGAVHKGFGLGRAQQTRRLLRAMDQPCFSLLAHPSGRLINQRAAWEFDLPQVLSQARARGCFVELNAQPHRLDLNDTACRMAKDQGVLVAINSDARSAQELGYLRHGVVQARRGWLQAGDALNTRPLAELRSLLRATMA